VCQGLWNTVKQDDSGSLACNDVVQTESIDASEAVSGRLPIVVDYSYGHG
jgi:hypothetical protein